MKQRFAPRNSYGCKLHFGEEARKAMVERAQYISKIVGRTMGPFGSPVMLDRNKKVPSLTKDGVTVLYDIEKYDLTHHEDDHLYNTIYEIFRGASEEVSKLTGDGTSSVVWLVAKFMHELGKCFNADLDPRQVIAGFNYAMDYVMDTIAECAIEATDEKTINAALYTAANGDEEIVNTLTDVFLDVGDEGMIFIRDPQAVHTKVFYEEGMDLPIKLDTPEILDSTALKLEMKNPYILVVLDKINSAWDLVNILEDINTRGEVKDLVIAYSEISEDALSLIHKNNYSKDVKLRIASFRMPLYTDRQRDYLLDFAAVSDAPALSKAMGHNIRKSGLEQLGRAGDVVLRSSLCSVVNGRGRVTKTDDGRTVLQRRIDEVTADRDAFTGNIEERNRFNERLAKMTGAVVSICPGAHSRAEIIRKKGAYEDAIRAGQCAIRGGIVPGAGWLWYVLADSLDRIVPHLEEGYEYIAGVKAARNGIASVFEKLCEDAGTTAAFLNAKLRSYQEEHGIPGLDMLAVNLRTMDVGLAVDVKVVDPALLHEHILSQARSIASTLMNSGCVITIEPTEEFKKFKAVQRFQHLRV